LNNLVFPFHEQHHNNSFLIATMIMGQSNMAAGATVGSNHNSRGNDGEIIAGRGFWPGLSSTLKHNCRFASFVLIAKGNYPAELNIPLPFSLLTTSVSGGGRRELMPGYWWLHNMYALERNAWKFASRDKRIHKDQHIETDYMAPDTAAEIINAIGLLGERKKTAEKNGRLDEDGSFYVEGLERSRQLMRIVKPERGLRAYREMLLYYAVRTIAAYISAHQMPFMQFQTDNSRPGLMDWVNCGGQLVPQAKLAALFEGVKAGRLSAWPQIHAEYDRLWAEYAEDKALNALQVLRYLESGALDSVALITKERWNACIDEALRLRRYIEDQVYRTKRKDYKDPFRLITFRNSAEMNAVLGRLEDNPFIRSAQEETARFITLMESVRP
jgi:hypothetical protein